MMEKFNNKNRNRYYGLRIGDLVQVKVGLQSDPIFLKAEVIEYGFLDNNRVYLRFEDGKETSWVAEQCEIFTKIEDR